MTLSDGTGQDATYAHDRHRTRHDRHGRHGRPGPFGGRLRLPTLRFSGAAMAMSTVVGISIATTFLLNEQQGVGRRAGVARVGTSGPPPSPDTSPDASGTSGGSTSSGTGTMAGPDKAAGRHPSGPAAPAPGASSPAPGTRAPDAVPSQRTAGSAAPRPGGSPSTAPLAEGPSTRHGVTDEPAAEQPGTLADGRPDHPRPGEPGEPGTAGEPGAEQLAAGEPGARRPAGDPSASEASPSPSASPSPAKPSPSAPKPFVPAPGTPGEPAPSPREWTGGTLGTTDGAPQGSDPAGAADRTDEADEADGSDDQALAGTAVVQSLGRDGTRHVLALTVTEPLTALQAEVRLAPGTAVHGTGTAWTDLAGAVVSTHQERGAAVYRFTTPPGTDVRPGRYTFAVRGTRSTGHTARPAGGGVPRAGGHRTPGSWNASAFGIGHPRAVAALGTFTAPAPAPAQRATAAPAR
ncbi:hypothetical protein [Kitasatospora sp. NPDC057500]|uniref:hypothetical protein n=1 Tax=Kitasatospora sp. NPDC057500 TaxID=3346151 RepID=UPI0036999FCC